MENKQEIINQVKNKGVVEESWDDDLNDRITIKIITAGAEYSFLVFNNYDKVREIHFGKIEETADKYIEENPRLLDLQKRAEYVEEYVEGIKEYLESNKIINLGFCEYYGVNYNDILDELDRQEIKYRVHEYFDENGVFKNLAYRYIYCNQFFIE